MVHVDRDRSGGLPRGQDDHTYAAGRTADPWRYRWVILGVATFTQAASGFFMQGIGALGVHLQRGLDLSTAQLGLLLSASQLVPLVGLLVAGELLDRCDERWVVGIGAGVVAVSLAAGSLAPGYASLLLVLLVVGAGYSTVQPGGSKSVASWFDVSQRGLAMGIRQAGLPLGGVLAAAVLPFLATALGWRATLVAGGLVALLGAVAFMAFYRRPPDHGPSQDGGPDGARSRAPLKSRLRMLREPSMVKILLSGTSMVSVHGGLGVLTVLHLHETASVGETAAALVFVAVQAAGVAGRICLAAWSDRSASGRYTVVAACMIAVAAGTAVLMTPLGRSPAAACLLFVWLGFFGIGWYGPWVAYVAESAPPGKTGFALGLAMAVTQIAVILAPPALGLLRDLSHSFTLCWGVLSAVTAAVAVVTTRAGRRP
ncbi:MFS transporter [Actinomadura rubrobrunea]|uniref:MFS transporter n=1 Tax=Actinomadura rubrobrunea TaxID=115335 RepID=A0A9W6UWK2_9ACTN|nr:MFS transporter [Actinomadura rubrobrunea]GLW66274.1 MFS transporter [Actinomadura rubrobrunea]